MLTAIRKVFSLFSAKDRLHLYGLILMVIAMGLLETIGIASIFPFLGVLTDPEMIQTNEYLKWCYDTLEFEDSTDFVLFLGSVTFVILMLTNGFRAFSTWIRIYFMSIKRHLWGSRLLRNYLYEPYVFFLNRNSAEVKSYVMSEINLIVSGILGGVLELFSGIVVGICIIVLLFVTDPLLTSIVTLVFGGAYGLLFRFVRVKLSKLGTEVVQAKKSMMQVIAESVTGIKTVKVQRKEEEFIRLYDVPSYQWAWSQSLQKVLVQFPGFVFEVLAFGGILIITFYFSAQNNFQQVLPLIGVYAFGTRRLMAVFGGVYQKISVIQSAIPSLDALFDELCKTPRSHTLQRNPQPIPFEQQIELQNLVYHYPKTEAPALDNLSMTIPAQTTIGLVGSTGAGKTTLVDVVMGLLLPDSGKIIVDGHTTITEENLYNWQSNIGYVPQKIYLNDDTVRKNIAFGIADGDISDEAVERAARFANIHDFIIENMPRGYDTMIGENGLRLSGGQQQRIGIARALYQDPAILVLDEATSALDGMTEDSIMEAIHNLARKKTLILVAHRLSTLQECDTIYMLEAGKLMDQGSYSELLQKNSQFRKMAKVDFKSLAEAS